MRLVIAAAGLIALPAAVVMALRWGPVSMGEHG